MSRLLCKKEKVVFAILQIEVIKDAKNDSFHTRRILKRAHRSGLPSHLSERTFNQIRRPDFIKGVGPDLAITHSPFRFVAVDD